ncbi:MAG TPA: SAM-dependent methyltransferase [Nitrosospira sp.]|nr:SAM-dependent methyltransferase [Nitrosospira sp.]
MSTGILYLIPVPLGNGEISSILPDSVRRRALELDYFVVEHPKAARKFLKQAGCTRLQDIRMSVLDEHTPASEIESLLEPLLSGSDGGLLSEAGCPGVADPGADLVRLAYKKNIRVVPLVGPSAILLALMASGLNGQQFAFHGYLPVDRSALVQKLLELEKESQAHDQTQIFIETPYRNQKLLACILSICRDNTLLSVSSDLTTADEFICTKTVSEWRHNLPNLDSKPSVFLLHA